MRLNIFALIFILALTGCIEEDQLTSNDQILQNAYENGTSGLQVEGGGKVISILADDNDPAGGRHQKFILKLQSNQTLLIAHNIDVAPRVSSLQTNDWVGFYGVYEWNNEGGLIHWTHIDPRGDHVDGWLEHEGIVYDRY